MVQLLPKIDVYFKNNTSSLLSNDDKRIDKMILNKIKFPIKIQVIK